MTRRLWMPLWLGALAASGTVIAHAVAYFLLAPDPHARAQLLSDTGHRYWDLATAFGVGALVAGAVAYLHQQLRTGAAETTGWSSIGFLARRLVPLQCAAFLLLEGAERTIAGHAPHIDEVAIVAIGIALQCALGIAISAVLGGCSYVIQRLHRRSRPRADAAPVVVRGRSSTAPTMRRLARGDRTLRGPPLDAPTRSFHSRDKENRMRKRVIAAAVAAAALLAVAAPASAHVTANPNTGPAEGRVTTFFKVSHGCDESPVTQVSVKVPDGVIGAGPEDEPGWGVETKMRQLDEPIEGEDEDITEVVDEVIWTAEEEPLDPHQFREFGLSLNIAAPGEDVLYFPTVQKCEKGQIRWVNIPPSLEEWHDTEDPAPFLELTETEGHGATEDDTEATAEAAMSEDEIRAIAASEASAVEQDSGTNLMVWVALALGAIGFLLGLGAFVRSGKRA